MAKRKRDLLVVTGNKEIDRKLRGIPYDVQRKLVQKATRGAMKFHVLPEAVADAPIDTGFLQDSLKVRATRGRRGTLQFGHAVTSTRDAFYGGFLEFGTQPRRQASGRPVGAIFPGKFSWLRRALYDNEGPIRELFEKTLKAWIRQYAKTKQTRGKLQERFIDPPE